MDFLNYERFVILGGHIVFDEFPDAEVCPEVGPTIYKMRHLGVVKD